MKAFKSLFQCCIPKDVDNRHNLDTDDESKRKSKSNNNNIDMIGQYTIDIDVEEQIVKNYEGDLDAPQANVKGSYSEQDDFDRVLFEERLIRDDEKEHIKFTKNGLIEFCESQMNLDEFELLYNQNKLLLHIRKKGSVLNQDFSMAKGVYTLAKNKFKSEVSIEFIAKMMYNPEQRIEWDTSLKVLKRLEEGEDAYVIRSWMHSPIFMVAEREVIDKRIEIFKDGVYYNISTSTPADVKIFYLLYSTSRKRKM